MFSKNVLVIGLAGALIMALTTVRAQDHLDAYIQQGLHSNQSLQQQNFVLEKNMYALKEAQRLYYPDVSFRTTYTKAAGGRTIDFPTGDLFNGAYATLNQLTGTQSFPQLKNERILLNPDNFYDARFRISLPLLNAELKYNRRIKQQQVDLQKVEVLLYKRELVKEIKTAYYTYLKALNAVKIYESSLQLVEEGQRINARLFSNDKVNRTAVIRSKNEVTKINASFTNAKKNAESAAFYFNFLLNRPLTDAIASDSISHLPDYVNPTTANTREELTKLSIARDINGNVTDLAKSYLIPKIGTSLDLGSQAFDWQLNLYSRYYLLGVSLEWNLFSFGKNTYRIKQSVADQQALIAQTDYVQQQLLTELEVRKKTMAGTLAQYQAAQSQLKTSQTYYEDMVKLYKEGMAIYIELLDAQNQWIEAKLQTNLALFDTWIAFAQVERASASFNIY